MAGPIKKVLDAAGKKIARTNMPTSFTALLEGKNIVGLEIAIRKLATKDELTKSEFTMLRKLRGKLKEVETEQSSEVPPKSDRPKNKKQPSKPDMSMAMKDGGMPMVKKDGKKIPAFAADGVGKMMKGGMAKKKPAAKKMMAGGMAKPKAKASGYMYGGMAKKPKAKK